MKQDSLQIIQLFPFRTMKGIPSRIFLIWVVSALICLTNTQNNNPDSSTTNQTLKCQKTQYTSMFTMCQINFDFCNTTSFSFLSCYKKQCDRYVRASECRLWTKIDLTQTQCYKQCCGATLFDENTCNQFNSQKEESQSQITGVIIAIIVVSAVVLVSVAAYLMIKVQKCCKKNEFKKISKYNIFWRNEKVPDSVCELCKNYGAIIHTTCNHFFHASCFQQNTKQADLPLCPTCQAPIRQRLKISCNGCKQKVFKIKLWRIAHLQEIMKQSRALHDQVCPQSAKSDQHLLISPHII